MKINRNNTDIMRVLNKELQSDKYINDEKKTMLKNHQFLIKSFFYNVHFDDVKGLLLFHKMGTGKSILSISIALDFPGDVIVFLSSSLINNFINDIKKFLSLLNFPSNFDSFISSKFSFISLNAFNLHSKIPSNLKHKLIIIDEAHHLFSGVVNGSKNHLALYYALRSELDLNLILLTGTPIYNDPYELMICLNLLTKHLTFPESYDDFISTFIDVKFDNDSLYKHRLAKLENRIVGLVSFFEFTSDSNYPDDFGVHIIKCPMLTSQLNKYLHFKKIEDDKSNFLLKRQKSSSISKSHSFSNYRIQTRMICNIDPEFDLLSCVKFINIFENILKYPGCALVYSQFVNNYGLLAFAQFLLKKNYLLFDFDNVNSLSPNFKYFSIIKGDLSFDKRNSIQQIFNSPDNKLGDIIHILLISSAGAEGLDLKFIRTVHILEPYWNYSRIDQIKSRAIRFQSHILLPTSLQNVYTFIYLSTLNSDSLTTDEDIYSMALNKLAIINDFLYMLKRVSIDCFFHFHDCYSCDSSDIPLFRSDFLIDINLANPCFTKSNSDVDVTHFKDDIYYDQNSNTYYKKVGNKLIKI